MALALQALRANGSLKRAYGLRRLTDDHGSTRLGQATSGGSNYDIPQGADTFADRLALNNVYINNEIRLQPLNDQSGNAVNSTISDASYLVRSGGHFTIGGKLACNMQGLSISAAGGPTLSAVFGSAGFACGVIQVSDVTSTIVEGGNLAANNGLCSDNGGNFGIGLRRAGSYPNFQYFLNGWMWNGSQTPNYRGADVEIPLWKTVAWAYKFDATSVSIRAYANGIDSGWVNRATLAAPNVGGSSFGFCGAAARLHLGECALANAHPSEPNVAAYLLEAYTAWNPAAGGGLMLPADLSGGLTQ